MSSLAIGRTEFAFRFCDFGSLSITEGHGFESGPGWQFRRHFWAPKFYPNLPPQILPQIQVSSPEVGLGVALNDLDGVDVAVPAGVGVGDAHDGVDVGVGELHHLGKVLHVHHGVVQVHLEQGMLVNW